MRRTDATQRLLAVLASQSAQELAGFLDDRSPGIARAAIHRLAEIQRAGAAPELRRRLLSADLSLVADIATALRTIEDRGAVAHAIAGLSQEPYTRRLAAAMALGALRDARATDALGAALTDEIAGVRRAALNALAQIGPPAAAAASGCARLLSDADASVRIAAVRTVACTAPRPGAVLAEAAHDPDRLVRLEVARHVAGLPAQAAIALLTDPDLRVREAAAQAAGLSQLDQLALLLANDPSGDVRHAAALTLGRLGDQRVADVLVSGIVDPDAIVRAAVLRALEHLLTRAGAITRLCEELGAERADRRRASLYALGHLKASEAAKDVQRLADDPQPDVRLALLHIVDIVVTDPEPLVRYLAADEDSAVRHSAEIWLLRGSRSRARL